MAAAAAKAADHKRRARLRCGEAGLVVEDGERVGLQHEAQRGRGVGGVAVVVGILDEFCEQPRRARRWWWWRRRW